VQPTISPEINNVFVPTQCLVEGCGRYVDPGDIYFVRDHDRSDYVCYECAVRLAPDVFEAAMATFE
jgi:hypothetical protein